MRYPEAKRLGQSAFLPPLDPRQMQDLAFKEYDAMAHGPDSAGARARRPSTMPALAGTESRGEIASAVDDAYGEDTAQRRRNGERAEFRNENVSSIKR